MISDEKRRTKARNSYLLVVRLGVAEPALADMVASKPPAEFGEIKKVVRTKLALEPPAETEEAKSVVTEMLLQSRQ